ncbi:MAG: hypothetical protein RL226_125 [Bacteroidota bacterium]
MSFLTRPIRRQIYQFIYMITRWIVLTLLIAAVATGCKGDRFSEDPVVENFRYSSSNLLPALQKAVENPERGTQDLYQEFGSFWEIYCEDVMHFGPANEPVVLSSVQEFLTHPDMQSANAAIEQNFSSKYTEIDQQLSNAFLRYEGYLGDYPTPQVVYMNSGFIYSVLPSDSALGIGLEYFLGVDHPIVKQLDPQVFPQYVKNKMKPEFLVSEALRGWLLVQYQDQYYSEKTLLDALMYWGKIMYILDVLLPTVPDHLKMSYTEAEQQWCTTNERNIWLELSKQDILYESRRFEINRWIADGPFTRVENVPQDAPSRIGIWMAREIVRDYMNRNEKVTLHDLLEERNYLPMLNAYRPE